MTEPVAAKPGSAGPPHGAIWQASAEPAESADDDPGTGAAGAADSTGDDAPLEGYEPV